MEEILLSTINENSVLPSFLELYSLHQLAVAPSLTLRHLTSAILPTSLQEYSENCHEVLSVAQLLLQSKVLLNTGASVGEHLYGLVQVTKSQNGTYKPLTTSEKKLCIISMLLPFALFKLKDISLAHESHGDRESAQCPTSNTGSSLSRLLHQFRRVQIFFTRLIKKHKVSIASVCMLHKVLIGIQQLAFLFSLTTSFYPVHQYLGISLIRKKDLHVPTSNAASASAVSPHATAAVMTSTAGTTSSQSSAPTNHAVTILFLMALGLKVAEMLNRVDSSSPPPPPETSADDSDNVDDKSLLPVPPTVLTHYCSLPSDPRLCPLCSQILKNPSASRGGYVFCYACLCTSLARHPFCPVTGIGCTIKDVIRLNDS